MAVSNCQHVWLRYRYGHNSRRPLFGGGGTFLDGGAPLRGTLVYLLIDDEFAQELALTRNPPQTWSALVSALNSNKAFEDEFHSWWMESDHVAFSVWAATNGLPH